MRHEKSRMCRCEALEKLISDEDCPIAFDEKLNEYNIISLSRHAYYRMYYCFFCGGVLPKSHREALYTKPNKKELDEIEELLGKLRTANEVIGILGKPDKESEPPPGENDQAAMYRRHYVYSARWKSLDLTVRERADHSFDLAVVGKFIEAKKD